MPEALEGNINALLALMVVVGFRYPAAWALALLTKVSTGVGLLWFVVRGEWRAWLAAAAVAAVLAAISYLWWPDPWRAWVALLVSGSGGGDWYFPARLVVSVALVVWGARTDRRWTVPASLVLASPILFLNTLTILAAIPRLAAARTGSRAPQSRLDACTRCVPASGPAWMSGASSAASATGAT